MAHFHWTAAIEERKDKSIFLSLLLRDGYAVGLDYIVKVLQVVIQ